MHYKESAKILKVAEEKIIDEKLWQRWLVDLPNMDKDTFIGFEDYKNKLINSAKIKNRSKAEKEADYAEARKIAESALKILNPKNDVGKLPKKGGVKNV
jgi:4'-phosphopantetheinyl transferase EntD